MNSFGRSFKVEIFGESHGPALGVVLDGVPAGLAICEKDFVKELEKRNPNKNKQRKRAHSKNRRYND